MNTLSAEGQEQFSAVTNALVTAFLLTEEDAAALAIVAWKLSLWESVAEHATAVNGRRHTDTRRATFKRNRIRQLLAEADRVGNGYLPDCVTKATENLHVN
jgi:hypothetical protein